MSLSTLCWVYHRSTSALVAASSHSRYMVCIGTHCPKCTMPSTADVLVAIPGLYCTFVSSSHNTCVHVEICRGVLSCPCASDCDAKFLISCAWLVTLSTESVNAEQSLRQILHVHLIMSHYRRETSTPRNLKKEERTTEGVDHINVREVGSEK